MSKSGSSLARKVLIRRLGWNQTAPAFKVFPTLERFRPTLQTRSSPLAPPGAEKSSMKGRYQSFDSLYHDLGVCVYAGASVRDLERMGDLLKAITRDGGSQSDQKCAPRPATKGSKREDNYDIDKMHSRWFKYRFQTEDRHIDQDWRAKDGCLSFDAIYELCMKAARNWLDETKRAAQEKLPELGVKHYVINEIKIPRPMFITGILHQTVNGPRRLNVDANCRIFKGPHSISIMVTLATVGTGKFVGCAELGAKFTTTETLSGTLPLMTQETIRRVGPSLPPVGFADVVSITNTLFDLEHSTWASKVDKKEYPSYELIHDAVKSIPPEVKAKIKMAGQADEEKSSL